MSKINRHPVRRTAAGVLAGALALSGAVAAGTPAFAAPGFALDRIAGDNRYETSARIAEAFGVTSGAILASGEVGRSVDALSANFLAGVQGVPVLLTQRDRIPASVQARLNALSGAKNVTIVGGTVAVSAAVEAQLRAAGFTVTRLGGADRYATSEEIIRAGASSASTIGLVASGLSFPDALAGGPLSYKGKHPVFLTAGSGIPGDTIDAMVAAGTRQVIILGGTAAVPASVESALAARGITVLTRLGGAGRSETSRLVADYLIANQGFVNTTFNVASGAPRGEGVDALSGAALSGKQNRTLLVTDTATSAAPVVAFAAARSRTLNTVGNIFGGPAAVSTALEAAIEVAGQTLGNNQSFTAAPSALDTNTFSAAADDPATTADETNRGRHTYTVTGLSDAQTYDIALFRAEDVTVAASGAVSFADAETVGGVAGAGNNVADFTATEAVIELANGAAVTDTNGFVQDVRPVNGAITFVIDSDAADQVRPVIFLDADNGSSEVTEATAVVDLDLDANNLPLVAEAFGIGGQKNYVAPAAAAGTITAADITSVNAAGSQFSTASFGYTFDANDIFQIGGVQVTQAAFVASLSAGDRISGTVATDPSLPSTYNLDNLNPDTPAAPTVTPGTTNATVNDITVVVTVTGDVDSVQFQRALVTGGVVGAFSTIATEPATDDIAGTAGIQVRYVDNDVAAGAYQYRAVFVNDGDAGTPSPVTAITVTAPGATDTTAPVASDTRVLNNTGSAFLLETGDTVRVLLSEAVVLAGNATVRLVDADGTTVDIPAAGLSVNAAAETIGDVSYAAGRVLTITRGAADVVVAAGTTSTLSIPATITRTSGVADAAGNELGLTGSADVVADVETA